MFSANSAWRACVRRLLARARSRLLLPVLLALVAGAAALRGAPVINELMYRPGTTYPENTGLEFIELYNPDATAVDLSGWAFTQGVSYTFPAGTTIAAKGYVVVAANVSSLQAATGLATVYGPWTGHLANNGETVALSKPGDTTGAWTVVDEVDYADEGDWATRTRDSLGGWSWVSRANSAGASLERRNPSLATTNGQNWGASTATGGSPGAANSLLSTNVAPVITDVKHSPAVPTSSSAVTISCSLADESAASALTATLWWRVATSTSPGSYAAVTMDHDGSGNFTAALPAMAAKTIVEFYISATDGTNTRTWPAPSSEGQNTNGTYQVDDEVVSSAAPVYRLVLTAAENAAFTSLASSNPNSDREFNVTLVVTRGIDTTIRYLCSMRIRGNSSRSYTFKPLHFKIPNDHKWDGVSSFNLNPKASYLQYLAMRLQTAAGLVAADVSPVELRRQGTESTVSSGATGDFGMWVRVEDFNGDYADNHFPLAQSVQLYRKTSTSSWAYTSSTAPTSPSATWSGWQKENNSAANDWSDVMAFTKTWQDTAAPYFNNATSGNVAAGTWNNTGFSDANVTTLSNVADLDYLARWMAVFTILLNNEPNLSTGEDDDYAAAFVNDGTTTRMVLLPHDMDTILGTGDGAVSATAVGLYDMTETDTVSRAGVGSVTLMKPLLPLMGNSSTTGNAAFRAKYYAAIRELYGTVFDADTSANAYPPFYQFVDNHLSGWASATVRSSIKSFMTQRQAYLLGLIGAAKTTPAAATSTATLAATSTPSLRLNEVLATNTKIALDGTYPDIIELHNAGTAAVSLAGRSLTDDPATPQKYVFPAGTTIAAGGYLVLYADTNTTGSGLHTGFALDAEGDVVQLYDSDGTTLLDTITFGYQISDYSISRTGSSADTWALTVPTAGAANGAAVTLGSPAAVKINEWAGRIGYRVDHDFVELYNPAATPVALAGVRLTDDAVNYPSRFAFPALSFIAPTGFVTLYGADITFALDADFDLLALLGANGTLIDQVDFAAQPAEYSTGRATDGGMTWASFAVPTPGISNATTLPSAYTDLLNNLRITELMYQPAAASSASDYEFIELKNIGATTLDLSGVRFTNGLDYTFASGTTLAAGAYVVVAKARSTFLTRYPGAAATLAAGSYDGALDNTGETIALTLPAPWYVHILKFRYETDWYAAASGGGCSIVVRDAAATAAEHWAKPSTWRVSSSVNGNPGGDDTGGFTVVADQSGTVTLDAGNATTLSVTATTSYATTYQWQMLVNGEWQDISGATAASLALLSAQAYQSSTYRCLVTANAQTIASDPVVVSVTAVVTTAGRLVNLSTRGWVGTGNQQLFPGFVISGTGAKPMLIRGVGPTLADLNVDNRLADPQLSLKRYESGAYADLLASDNWSDASNAGAIVTAAASVGAFSLHAGSTDAAILTDLSEGMYSAITRGASDGTGIALVEVYDTNSSASQPRLVNLSARGFAGTGSEVLIGGFVVSYGPKTLLIRAVGPRLTALGLPAAEVLADPQMAIYGKPSGSTTDQVLLTNDDWGSNAGAATTASTAAGLGAFELPAGSKDAAFVATFQPGSYTVLVSGVGGTTGIALLEIYVVE
ncbi:lamin tail domain-containing protein [Opitutus sp. ER46]|uniref:lamin tail domain-containing protein n=1 Tax=Opitutus sp. ER46 TaxID=2161864 RepID=UPI000D31D3B0|nr:lamin tail domain-containing protein [Opitutus sp. ER46]PTX98450.1 hypothetical protein DB354_04060 [Opitutus sp. ER46]